MNTQEITNNSFHLICLCMGILLVFPIIIDRFKRFALLRRIGVMKGQFHTCSKCYRGYVRLYRPYGEFLRATSIRCNRHIPKQALGWYIPMIENDDGLVWGYTSVPINAIKKWESLLDSDLSGVFWDKTELCEVS